MTFFFRYLLNKRKHRNSRRPVFRKRRKRLESAESPWQQTLQADQTNEEQDKLSEHAEELELADPCLVLELPTSIMADILSRLSFKVVCICRCVCKAWRTVTHSPDFNSLRLERADSEIFLRSDSAIYVSRTLHFVDLHGISASVPPRDMLQGRAMDLQIRVFLPKRERVDMNMVIKTRNASSGAKRDYDIVNSCNGFICLRKTSMFIGCKNPCIVCNPFTGEFTFIPKPEKKGTMKSWTIVSGFGFSLRNNVYKVVRLVYGPSASNPFDRITEVHTLGSDSWRTVGNAPWDTIQESSATFLNGAIHWLSEGSDAVKKNSILCFDFEDEKFHVLHLPARFLEKLNNEPSKSKLSLGVLRSCLCVSGVVYMNCFDIWVMRDYREHESWTNGFSFRIFFGAVCRPIKWLENGDLVMLWNKMTLVFYNPTSKLIRKFKIQGARSVVLEAIAHIPSFGSLKDIAGGNNLVVHNAPFRWDEPEPWEEAEAISLVEEENQGMDWAFNIW